VISQSANASLAAIRRPKMAPRANKKELFIVGKAVELRCVAEKCEIGRNSRVKNYEVVKLSQWQKP
jgi:hypothetical protein